MKFPVFYSSGPFTENIVLNEETSKHVAGVLRMEEGEKVAITDGRGYLYTTEITSIHKRKTVVSIISREFYQQPKKSHTIGISLLKNTGRFEWFLEKATELGIARIVPLICERTEKQGFRLDRMQQICISAMLQSQQVYMPELKEPVAFNKYFNNGFEGQQYIAHCLPDPNKLNLSQVQKSDPVIFLIGPEGDFTQSEIALAKEKDFTPVSLGVNRLRTETAGLAVALWLTLA
jgi:16S rRNA (uracil1498-N3)-methyltransferase